MKNAQQVGTNPNVLAELKILRQRKDELEMRMSALQETRRELMVQLEGLMKLLKVCLFLITFSVNTTCQSQRMCSCMPLNHSISMFYDWKYGKKYGKL